MPAGQFTCTVPEAAAGFFKNQNSILFTPPVVCVNLVNAAPPKVTLDTALLAPGTEPMLTNKSLLVPPGINAPLVSEPVVEPLFPVITLPFTPKDADCLNKETVDWIVAEAGTTLLRPLPVFKYSLLFTTWLVAVCTKPNNNTIKATAAAVLLKYVVI